MADEIISKEKKQINALMYAIHQKPKIGRTKLMKFIFFVDLVNYNEKGSTLLENTYVRKTWGPVPETAFKLTEGEVDNDLFKSWIEQLTPERIKYNYHPKKEADLSVFSEKEISFFDLILNIFDHYHSEEISKFTHEFDLWKKIESENTIPLELFRLDDFEYMELLSRLVYEIPYDFSDIADSLSEYDEIQSLPEDLESLQYSVLVGD
jgi:hypothetical protein